MYCTGVYCKAFDMHFEPEGATILRPTAYAPQVPSPQSCRLGFFSTYSQGYSRVIYEARTLAHRPLSPCLSLHWRIDWCIRSPLLFGERSDELAAEGRDISDDAAPDEVSFAERSFIYPGSAGVLEVVFDP